MHTGSRRPAAVDSMAPSSNGGAASRLRLVIRVPSCSMRCAFAMAIWRPCLPGLAASVGWWYIRWVGLLWYRGCSEQSGTANGKRHSNIRRPSRKPAGKFEFFDSEKTESVNERKGLQANRPTADYEQPTRSISLFRPPLQHHFTLLPP